MPSPRPLLWARGAALLTVLAAPLITPLPASAQPLDIAAYLGADPGPQSCAERAAALPGVGRRAAPYTPPEGTRVSTARGLKWALRFARAGDVIVLEDGTYDLGWVRIRRSITLAGASQWGAVITDSSMLELTADGIRIEGLAFRLGADTGNGDALHESLRINASSIALKNNDFSQIGMANTAAGRGGIAVSLWTGDDLLLEDNRFSNMRGMALGSTDTSRGITIRHNDFLDSPDWGGFGEIAQIGNAWSTGQATTPAPDDLGARIIRNYVCGWEQESELISLKGDGNLVEGNLIERSGSSAIVVRMGNANTIRGNVIRAGRGQPVRLSGERNVIEGNLFQGTGRLAYLHTETTYTPDYTASYGGRLERAYWAANDNIFRANTYVGHDRAFHVQTDEDSRGALGDIWSGAPPLSLPTGNRFEGNVVYTPDPGAFAAQLLELAPQTVTSRGNEILPVEDIPPRGPQQ